MKQSNIVPDRVATVVVHPTPGIGDATSISDAVAMLAAIGDGGGDIFLREGTYSLSSTVTLPDRSVNIRGCGDQTLIDLGANAIPAFTIPDGLTSQRAYLFENFKVIGNSVADQKVVSIEDTNARGSIVMRRVNTGSLDTTPTINGVRGVVAVVSGDISFLRPVFIDVHDCWFVPVSAVDPSYLVFDTTGAGWLVSATFKKVNYYVDLPIPGSYSGTGIGGSIANDSGDIDVSFYDCNLSITEGPFGAEDSVGSINAVNTNIFNWGGFGQVVLFINPFAASDQSTGFFDCILHGYEIIAGTTTSIFSGGWYVNTTLTLIGNFGGSVQAVVGVGFESGPGGNTAGQMINCSGFQAFIDGCSFSPGVDVEQTIKITSGTVTISHCGFNAMAAGGGRTAGIQLGALIGSSGSGNRIHDNSFDDTFGVPPILELASVDGNRYDNNDFGETPTTQPVIIGPNSIFNGVRNKSLTAVVTTSAFTTQFTHRNFKGVLGIGTIKNTGGLNLEVQETVTDIIAGTTDSRTTVVAAGNTALLNPMSNIGTALPPYNVYAVAVRDQVGGGGTTFSLNHSTEGAQ